jgi:hypothetical protein
MGNLLRDRRLDPALDEFMRGASDVALAGLADALTAGFDLDPGPAIRVRSIARVALDFWTWERLASEGMDDDAAAALMTDAVAAVAGRAATGR